MGSELSVDEIIIHRILYSVLIRINKNTFTVKLIHVRGLTCPRNTTPCRSCGSFEALETFTRFYFTERSHLTPVRSPYDAPKRSPLFSLWTAIKAVFYLPIGTAKVPLNLVQTTYRMLPRHTISYCSFIDHCRGAVLQHITYLLTYLLTYSYANYHQKCLNLFAVILYVKTPILSIEPEKQ